MAESHRKLELADRRFQKVPRRYEKEGRRRLEKEGWRTLEKVGEGRRKFAKVGKSWREYEQV